MLIQQRMVNQRLWGKPFTDIEECVRALAAVQAQEFAYAKWSIGQRTAGITESLMEKAVADGTILRTHVMRPTWHFVLPEDIRWMIELTAPRVNALNAPYYRREGLDDAVFAKTNVLFTQALAGGNHLTRKEMTQVLARAGISAASLRLGLILMRAELDLVICSGAPQGKQQTYALVDERAPDAVSMTREEALAELVRRYFTTRGPATLKDFSWWSGLTQADAQLGLDSSLEREVVNGRVFYRYPAKKTASPNSPRVDLVQIYDEIAMSYSESRDALIDNGNRPAPDHSHSIMLDGKLVGHWRRTVKSKAVVFETQLFRPLESAESDALEAAQERYRAFSMDETTGSASGSVPGRKRASA